MDDGLAISIKGRMNMTELLVTPKSLNHMKTLIELGADAFVIGEQNLDCDYLENLIVKMLEKQLI